MRLPDARARQSRAELVRLSQLKAQSPSGGPQGRVAHALRPERQNPRLFLAEVLALALGKSPENVLVVLLGVFHQTALGAPPGSFRKLDHLVDHVQVAAVVNQPAVRVDLGVHLGPEENIRLELHRAGKVARRLGRDRRAPRQARKDDNK